MARTKETKDLTGQKILSMLREHQDVLMKRKVKRIGLFGSYVKGEQGRKSDIDLVVEFDRSAFDANLTGYFDNFMNLSSYLEKLFGRKVDILSPVTIESIRIKKVAEEIKRSVVYV